MSPTVHTVQVVVELGMSSFKNTLQSLSPNRVYPAKKSAMVRIYRKHMLELPSQYKRIYKSKSPSNFLEAYAYSC